MLLTFGRYTCERTPLNRDELDELGVSQKFVDLHLVRFLDEVTTRRIENPIHGKKLAGRLGWPKGGDAKIRKLRRCAWYLDICVGSKNAKLVTDENGNQKKKRSGDGDEDSDGYYWPRNAAEFQVTIDQYKGRFLAYCRTVPHLDDCQRWADIFAEQLRGISYLEPQTTLFPIMRLTEESCKSILICGSANV